MNLLFVCTGNTCRSPMCEAGFRHLLKAHGLEQEISCSSAGVAAVPAPASANAKAAVRESGLSLENHTARQFTPELASETDLIVAVSPSHFSAVVRIAPEAEKKTVLLCEGGVSDPFGGDLSVYRECFAEIRKALENLLETIIHRERMIRK